MPVSPSAFETAFGLLGPEDLSWQNHTFRQIQRWPTPLKTLSSCCGIPVFGGLATIFAGLELAELFYLMQFAGESLGYASLKSGHSTSVQYIAVEWDQLVAVYICKTCRSFHCQEATAKKSYV